VVKKQGVNRLITKAFLFLTPVSRCFYFKGYSKLQWHIYTKKRFGSFICDFWPKSHLSWILYKKSRNLRLL